MSNHEERQMKQHLAVLALTATTLTSFSANAGDVIVGHKKKLDADPSLTLVVLQAKADLKIESITVNRNPKCELKIGESEEQYNKRLMLGDLPFPKWYPLNYPLNISFGDKFGGVSSCNPLEIVIKTNKGDKVVEWDK